MLSFQKVADSAHAINFRLHRVPCVIYGTKMAKGAWIAEWSSHSTFEHRYATPWAVSSSLGDGKLFFGPKHNIYALFIILFDLFDLILLFVCQICHVNCEAEN